jgi:hypothetical protein
MTTTSKENVAIDRPIKAISYTLQYRYMLTTEIKSESEQFISAPYIHSINETDNI